MTVRTSASPWTRTSPDSRSSSCAGLPIAAARARIVVGCRGLFGTAAKVWSWLRVLHAGLERPGQIVRRWIFQDGVEVLLQLAPLAPRVKAASSVSQRDTSRARCARQVC